MTIEEYKEKYPELYKSLSVWFTDELIIRNGENAYKYKMIKTDDDKPMVRLTMISK